LAFGFRLSAFGFSFILIADYRLLTADR